MTQLPTIGGFAPLPLAVMIPFMASQSAALAYAFGINFEYGKRTVKSMSNETFNKLTPQDITNLSDNRTTVEIESFKKLIPSTFSMQDKILDEYLKLETRKIDMNLQLVGILADKLAQGANMSLENIFNKLFGIDDGTDVNVNINTDGGTTGNKGGRGGGTDSGRGSGAPGDTDRRRPPSGSLKQRRWDEANKDRLRMRELIDVLVQLKAKEPNPGRSHNTWKLNFAKAQNNQLKAQHKYIKSIQTYNDFHSPPRWTPTNRP